MGSAALFLDRAHARGGGAGDLGRIISHYTQKCGRVPRVIAVGYSLGADTLPHGEPPAREEPATGSGLTALLAPARRRSSSST